METTTTLMAEDEAVIINLLQKSLNSAFDVPHLLETFSSLLKDCEDISYNIRILLANSVDEYRELIINRDYLRTLRATFNNIYDLITENERDLNFKIDGRRKGVVNSIEKMLRLLKEGRSLDLFRDSMGIRVILFGHETEELQSKVFTVLEQIIQFMSTNRFTLCEADNIPKGIKLDKGIDILIPKKSLISDIYQTGVKDYVCNPKHNGYQSLHSIFRAHSANSSFIEIQVRTEEMHLNAEYNDANHHIYKIDKYGKRIHSKLDFSKVLIPGFRYLGENLIYDDIGLQTSLLTFYRTKSF